jgi:hypothetical protein
MAGFRELRTAYVGAVKQRFKVRAGRDEFPRRAIDTAQ